MRLGRFILLFAITNICLILGLQVWIDTVSPALHQKHFSSNQKFIVKQGQSLSQIAQQLQTDGLIPSAFWLIIYAKAHRLTTQAHQGHYLFAAQTPLSILNAINTGSSKQQYQFTIIPGWDMQDVLQALRGNPGITFAPLTHQQIAQNLNIDPKLINGALLPDTYFFQHGSSALSILKRAHKAAQNYINSIWYTQNPNISHLIPDKDAAIRLAAVVEKETGLLSEQPRIAGVFYERLKRNMRLQSDPTVIYALGEQYNGNLRRKNLRINHPSNTYRYSGIPPEAIAFPSRSALQAVLKPDLKGELYFVSKGDGTHAFSKTLSQHNQFVRRYQLKKK